MIAPTNIRLLDYVETYAMERGLRENSAYQMGNTSRMLIAFAGVDVTLDMLGSDLLNRWLVYLEANAKSVATVVRHRRNMAALWNGAFQAGLVERQPRGLRPIRYVAPPKEAWTVSEMERLLLAAWRQPGMQPRLGIPWRDYWTAFILVGWDSAMRFGDLMALTHKEIRPDGLFLVQQSKTGWPKIGRLGQETMEAIYRTFPPAREKLFPWPFSRKMFSERFFNLVRAAGIRQGGTKSIRRASATDVERQKPGWGGLQLGHRLPGIAGRNYLDMSQLSHEVPLPTRLKLPIGWGLPVRGLELPPLTKAEEVSDHDFTD